MARTALVLDCEGLEGPALALLDGLARLQLDLRRRQLELRLRNPSSALVDLIDLAGLAEVLRVEVRRESEEREEPLGVEEEGELADPPA